MQRSEKSLSDGWRFIRKHVPGAESPAFSDALWDPVTLPHTWNVADGHDGGNNYYRGPGWYRLKLVTGPRHIGKRLYLRFGAASLVADVYVNGSRAGSHRGGFGAFCFDITDLVRPGENVVAVRVDNSRFADVPPLSGDFTIFGGLYRDVRLLAVDPVHVSPLDDGSPGVYLRQSDVSATSATVHVTTMVRNTRSQRIPVSVEVRLLDHDGREQGVAIDSTVIEPSGTNELTCTLRLAGPRLWDGVHDPYLHRAEVLVREQGRITDRVAQRIGFRDVWFDPERGLLLNGKPYPMRGVNYHQDLLHAGWAMTRTEKKADFQLIREMGCTGVRMAHYQHDDYEYALCDEMGLLVWDELALVNEIGDDSGFADNAKQQLRELIKQHSNHPSIIVWSLFNELRLKDTSEPDQWPLVGELNALAHALDPTRPTVAASNMPIEHKVNLATNLIAFNRYMGWYGSTPQQWEPELDNHRAQLPGRAIGISEYGAGASVRQHEANPTTRPKPNGPWHPEEWQSIVHENAYAAIRDRPWLWCRLIWVMFDFASDGRNEGDHPGRNDKGLVTADRRTRKDAFFFYKAHWSDEPFVHITSRRFTPRPAGAADVKVYSNCEDVELLVNGKSLGRKRSADRIFLWQGVPLGEGKHDIRAIGRRGHSAYRDSCTWIVLRSATTLPVDTISHGGFHAPVSQLGRNPGPHPARAARGPGS